MSRKSNVKRRRAGLCVLDPRNRLIYIVRRKYSYGAHVHGKLAPSWRGNFVEEFQIPRGCCHDSRETLEQCALREFIEETGVYFKQIKILPTPFQLVWYDYGKWEYTIFFAFAIMEASNLIRVKESEFMELKLKFATQYEPITPQIMDVANYVTEVQHRLHLYGPNNYPEFLACVLKLMDTSTLISN